MIVADLIHFMFLQFLALLIIRYLQGKLNSNTTTAKTVAYIYH
jgi:hypothetical protein